MWEGFLKFMDCLKNYIQIEGCSAPAYKPDPEAEPEAASGLFINKDLPISLEQIDGIADEEQKTFLGVWDEIQNRALKKFPIVVKAGYRELFQVCNIDEDWFCTNKEALAMPLLYYMGAELMFERAYSSRINRWTTVDKSKAEGLKREFDREFQIQLKAALEIIHESPCGEGGDIFSFVETLP